MNRAEFIRSFTLGTLGLSTMSINDLDNLLSSGKASQRMPALFLGHGSPMNALENNPITRIWQQLGRELPTPTAIVSISAHWMTAGKTEITAMPLPKTIHDFGGFPKALYEVQYPAKGAPELAAELQKELQYTRLGHDHSWGLDHGTWSVLRHLYPKADIPVIQLSIDMSRDGNWHYNFGQALARWRNKGVLFLGSGNLVHNLRMLDWDRPNGGYDWAVEFDTFSAEKMSAGDFKPLVNFEKLGTAAKLSIPSTDHYLPLLYILGMQQTGEKTSFPVTGMQMGGISMRSVLLS
jgi:4,5-DOPA dioxygenase extradiol